MRKLIRFLSFSLTLAIAATLVACGGNNAGSGSNGSSAASDTNAQDSAAQQAKEAAYQQATEGEGIVNTFITDKFYDGKVTDEASAEKCVMSIIDRLGGNDKTDLGDA